MPNPLHRARRFSLDLLWCAARGHALAGTTAPGDGAEPLLLVETAEGHRLHRCLRCLDYVEHPAPAKPVGPSVTIDGVKIPARGRALRDALVLRLIAVDKGVHAALLALVGIALVFLSGNRASAHDSFLRVVVALNGSSSTPDQVEHRLHGVLGRVDWLLRLHTGTLYAAAGAVLAYAALNAVEAVGLWRMRRWAEYLSALATSLFLPIEIYELIDHITVFRVGTLIANLAIVGYLVYAKRLFGLRGGARAEHRLRMQDASWDAVRAEVARRRADGARHEVV
jgi:uncharacterized membrane protein (DUF2068 family)